MGNPAHTKPDWQSGLLVRGELLPPQDVVIMLGKAVGLVAHILKQAQRRRVPAESQWLHFAGAVNLFLALGQRDQTRRLDAEQTKGVEGGVELALAAVDEQDVREHLFLPRQPP